MKRRILLIFLTAFSLASFSQTGVKIYGYVQEVLPGTIPKGTDENGKKIEAVKVRDNYLIYISVPGKSRIYPIELWIKGNRFSAKPETVTTTPVQQNDNLGKPITLVAKTSNNVQRIIPIPIIQGKEFLNAKKKSLSNELVVVYKLNGKYYSATQKKLTRLEPLNFE